MILHLSDVLIAFFTVELGVNEVLENNGCKRTKKMHMYLVFFSTYKQMVLDQAASVIIPI